MLNKKCLVADLSFSRSIFMWFQYLEIQMVDHSNYLEMSFNIYLCFLFEHQKYLDEKLCYNALNQAKWGRMQSTFRHGISCFGTCPYLRQDHLYPKLSFTQPAFYLTGPINLSTASRPAESSWLQRSLALPEGWGGSGADSLLVHWPASNPDWKDSH